jgi:glyoxylase-like metal-dependent hydrolase (beta-lactamase superfamily II)
VGRREGRNVTAIFIAHDHGDHWFAAGLLAERFGARVVASAGTIAQMHANVATRPLLWDKVYLDDAEELLRTESTAVDFFNAKLERYPDHLGRTVLWVGASVLYGVGEHPDEDIRQITLASWLD